MVTRGGKFFFPFDPEGQERFTSMTRLYYREASACIIMFDVTNINTFSNSQKWKQDLDSKLMLPDGNPVPCLLLANKVSSPRRALCVCMCARVCRGVQDGRRRRWH